MKTEKDLNLYETPEMDVIELLLEQSILTVSEGQGDQDDPDVTIPGMGWGN